MRLRPLATLACALTISSAAYGAREDYDLEHEIPKVTIVGPTTPEYEEIAARMRQRLITQLGYWQARGLPNPPDLEGIFIFSDPKDLTVLEILNVLNPPHAGEPTLAEHLRRQRTALEESEFFRALNKLRKKSFADSLTRSDLLDFVFDFFCFFRYGFAVKHTFDAVSRDLKFSETKPFVMAPQKDNAFYGKFPRVDLTEILKPKQEHKKTSLEAIIEAVDVELLAEKIRDRSASRPILSRRIVILPRSTEGEGADDLTLISSLADGTIDTHELGHHINSSLAQDYGSLNRMLEEIWADWSTASAFGNETVGRGFAEASGRIAERFARKADLTAEETKLRVAFEKIGQKGYLRRFTDPSTIDRIARHHVMSNSYDGGNPARAFLWSLRERLNPWERQLFDEVTVEAIREAGHLPKVIAGANGLKLVVRSVFRALARHGAVERQKKKFFKQKDARMVGIMARATQMLADDEDQQAKLAKIRKDKPGTLEAEIKKRLLRKAAEVVTEDGFNVQTEAERIVAETYKRREEKALGAPGFLGLELRERPAVEADYILPEFFRAYHRVAQHRAPTLVEAMIEEAGRVMNATAVKVGMNDGTTELAFVRRTLSPHWLAAKDDVRAHLQLMHDLRPKITDLKTAADREKVKEQLELLEKEYDGALEKLQQFERTNSYFRMKYPSPVFGFGKKIAARIGKLSEKKKAALETCAARLTFM